jgi:hypothetical protein
LPVRKTKKCSIQTGGRTFEVASGTLMARSSSAENPAGRCIPAEFPHSLGPKQTVGESGAPRCIVPRPDIRSRLSKHIWIRKSSVCGAHRHPYRAPVDALFSLCIGMSNCPQCTPRTRWANFQIAPVEYCGERGPDHDVLRSAMSFRFIAAESSPRMASMLMMSR